MQPGVFNWNFWQRIGTFLIVSCEGSVTHSCLTLSIPHTVAHQAPLSVGFLRQEYWSGLPFPPPGKLLDPKIEAKSPGRKTG